MRRPYQKAWRGREALLESRGVGSLCRKARRPCRWAGRCCQALLEVQVVSEGPPRGLGGVESPIRMVKGLKHSQKGREESGVPNRGREW